MFTSCASLLPLRVLHRMHEQTTFSHVVSPPLSRGRTWSRLRSLRSNNRPQYWQTLPSRSKMLCRVNLTSFFGSRSKSISTITRGTRSFDRHAVDHHRLGRTGRTGRSHPSKSWVRKSRPCLRQRQRLAHVPRSSRLNARRALQTLTACQRRLRTRTGLSRTLCTRGGVPDRARIENAEANVNQADFACQRQHDLCYKQGPIPFDGRPGRAFALASSIKPAPIRRRSENSVYFRFRRTTGAPAFTPDRRGPSARYRRGSADAGGADVRSTRTVLASIPGGPAQDTSAAGVDPSEVFLKAFTSVQQGEKLEEDGKLRPALAKYRFAASLLDQLTQSNPNWQALIVKYRVRKTTENIQKLEDKLIAPAADRPRHRCQRRGRQPRQRRFGQLRFPSSPLWCSSGSGAPGQEDLPVPDSTLRPPATLRAPMAAASVSTNTPDYPGPRRR